MNIIKGQRFIRISEDGNPAVNEDSSFQIVEIYRGFETQEAYETTIKSKASTALKKQQEAEEKYNNLETERAQEQRTKLITDLLREKNVNNQFDDLILKNIDFNKNEEAIKNDVIDLIKNKPNMVNQIATGGQPKGFEEKEEVRDINFFHNAFNK